LDEPRLNSQDIGPPRKIPSMFNLALIAQPWPSLRRPSIQLGALKAYLAGQEPDLNVDAPHLYLDAADAIGIEAYGKIAGSGWAAETVFSALLHPERLDDLAKFFDDRLRERGIRGAPPLERVVDALAQTQARLADEIVSGGYDLVGLTVSLSQLMSSLFLIKELKKRNGQTPIVVGGASCAEELGTSLLRCVPEIDFVVDGEGERPLLELTRYLRGRRAAPPQGVWFRDHAGTIRGVGRDELPSLHELPTPDFSDYFARLKRFSWGRGLTPHIPLEASRGCWWNAAARDDGGCRFCNLNTQWSGFRTKKAKQLAREIQSHLETWEGLDFYFTDNSLPVGVLADALEKAAEMKRDLCFFGELRASVSREKLFKLRSLGFKHTQVGVEALSSSLLRRLHKGITAIQNIQIMRDCEEAGIINEANLILGFPGSDDREAEETLRAISYVAPYFPLNPVFFWLGYGSDVHRRPENYGISRVGPSLYYERLAPELMKNGLEVMIKTYAGDRGAQKKRWRDVKRALDQWRGRYDRAKGVHGGAPLLGYRDGGSFLLITRRYGEGPSEQHRLRGRSRELYLYCATARTMAQVMRRFPNVSEEAAKNFFNDLTNKKLIYQENGKILSLAIRERL